MKGSAHGEKKGGLFSLQIFLVEALAMIDHSVAMKRCWSILDYTKFYAVLVERMRLDYPYRNHWIGLRRYRMRIQCSEAMILHEMSCLYLAYPRRKFFKYAIVFKLTYVQTFVIRRIKNRNLSHVCISPIQDVNFSNMHLSSNLPIYKLSRSGE